jgi:hypothetical protein
MRQEVLASGVPGNTTQPTVTRHPDVGAACCILLST